MVVSAIAVFILVDNNLSSSLHRQTDSSLTLFQPDTHSNRIHTQTVTRGHVHIQQQLTRNDGP